jgi:pimeloyl-ACP methyl ester carboxylesterase
MRRWLYLHGFASGPDSSKGVALADHFRTQGVIVERMNLRLPSLEHLRVSAMVEAVTEALGAPGDRSIIFGSSLGGLVASRVAEADPRVEALVLLAPAFQLAELWRRQLGDKGLKEWEETGWLEVDDYARKVKTKIDYEFLKDARSLDCRMGGWPDVRVPTLIIHGKKDETVDISGSRTWAQGKPHVRVIEVDDGHDLGASLPRIFIEAKKFLSPFLPKSTVKKNPPQKRRSRP